MEYSRSSLSESQQIKNTLDESTLLISPKIYGKTLMAWPGQELNKEYFI